jgi:hypothetical protein
MTITAEGIGRILAETGNAPANLDRQELLSDLDGTASLYRTGVDQRSAPAKREQRYEEIIATAENLKSLLRSEYRFLRYLPALDRLIEDVHPVKETLDPAHNILTKKPTPDFPVPLATLLDVGHGHVSAFENLVGLLVQTYEKHFKPEEAGYTKVPDSLEVRGPFINFAEATLRELKITKTSGEPYKRKTIADALTTYRLMQKQSNS